ncbi:MAG: hypothetical protein ACAH83_16125 [Alphaproteobacteria bacterium]
MGFRPGSKLRKAFAVAAIAIGVMAAPGFTPPAEAAGSSAAAGAAAGAAAAAAAAARRAEDERVMNAVITNPSDQNIDHLYRRGLVYRTAMPFVREAVNEMQVPPGTKPNQITETQRRHLTALVTNKWRVGYISAQTPGEAVGKGLRESLAPYFTACKDGTQEFTFDAAKAAEQCMKDAHWEHDTKPALIKTVEIGGMLGGVSALVYAVVAARRRGRDGYSP